MITKQDEERAREMAKTVFKSENAGRAKGKAKYCICGYSGKISTSEPVKCFKCGLIVYRDTQLKNYYSEKAKFYCIKCALKNLKKLTALENDLLTRAQKIYEAENGM